MDAIERVVKWQEEQSDRAELCEAVTLPGELWRKYLVDLGVLLSRLACAEAVCEAASRLQEAEGADFCC